MGSHALRARRCGSAAVLASALIALCTIVPASVAGAEPGGLDPTFGSGGIQEAARIGSWSSMPVEIAPVSNGRILTVGTLQNGTRFGSRTPTTDVLIQRFEHDGSLDTSYGTDGIATANIVGADGVEAAVVLPDERVIVGGWDTSGQNARRGFLAMFSPTGSLDTTFGVNGIIDSAATGALGNGRVRDIAVDGAGRILVSYQRYSGSTSTENHKVIRFLSDGSVDYTFGTQFFWKTIAELNAEEENPSDPPRLGLLSFADVGDQIAPRPDGSTLVVGLSGIRLIDEHGIPDPGFGADGLLALPSTANWHVEASTSPNGATTIGSSSPDGTSFLTRVSADGTFDTGFGADGVALLDEPLVTQGGDVAPIEDLAVTDDGRVAVTSTSYPPTATSNETTIAVGRRLADGSPDPAFGDDGWAVAPVWATDGAFPTAIALQPDGHALAAGVAMHARYEGTATILRFLGSGGPPSDGDGVPAGVEDGISAPSPGDGNGDGIRDSQQTNVASLRNRVDGRFVTIAVADGLTLETVATEPVPADAPSGITFPVGVIGYRVHGLTPGSTTSVEIRLADGTAAPTTVVKRIAGTYSDVTSQAAISGNVITLTLTDGGPLDADGVANGVIVDPLLPAVGTLPVPTLEQSITFSPLADTTYGASPTPLVADSTSGLPVAFSTLTPATCSVALGLVIPSSVGDCTVQADQPGDSVHLPAPAVQQTFHIAPGAVTVTPTFTRTYGAADPAVTLTYSGLAPGDIGAEAVTGAPVCTPTRTTLLPGTYPLTCTIGTLTAANYVVTIDPGTATITKATVVVTPTDRSRVYGAASPTTFPVSYSGFVLGQTKGSSGITGSPTCSTSATAASPAGAHPITCTAGTLASGRYQFEFATGTLTITPKALTLRAQNASRTYGAPGPVLDVKISGFRNGETLSTSDVTGNAHCVPAASVSSPVGSYTVTCDLGTLTSNNYTFTITQPTAILKVTKATAEVRADDAVKAQGAANPPLTATISGLANGETVESSGITGAPKCTTTAKTRSPAGTYDISCGRGSLLSGNYNFTFVKGHLTVT